MYCHANWGASLGGISLPLLSDFHPKGAVAASYGLYLEDKGITDRATVIIDASGIVRYVASVGPGGERDISELAAECEAVDKAHGAGLSTRPAAAGVSSEAVLYIKNQCGFSEAVSLAANNLHLGETLTIKNVSEDKSAMEALEKASGKSQAPALTVGSNVITESGEIVQYFVKNAAR